ncbi:cell wall-binding repeat-containing protein [Ornithinimicrobium sp. F0845]|uniref:cell wall-binding repeat-containing protein n=1 Tax=Ornithinimicrobium sp. F0845 TaxID=2926412 RepID=UPI001FF35369|nr:cell wall-binding repeat-containing protein [Ornithinimicrobium sp. F0845]MCK0112656.1 cell wall-binding repeat-containing protein [Ornithinimicrobium sp. F0845]
MKRELASGILSLSLIAGGALAGAAIATQDAGEATGKGSTQQRTAAHFSPQDVVTEDGVSRVWGANRYATAAQISVAYGWDATITGTVYIASGQMYPDALAIGLSHFGDGPLLLVTQDSIPVVTRNELTRLQPCYIHVMGGEGAVNDTVFDALKAYADPTLCEAP